MNWQDMETAPRDGTEILVCRNNDLGWEYDVVFYVNTKDKIYPWFSMASDDAYPEGRLDYWTALEPPYKIKT